MICRMMILPNQIGRVADVWIDWRDDKWRAPPIRIDCDKCDDMAEYSRRYSSDIFAMSCRFDYCEYHFISEIVEWRRAIVEAFAVLSHQMNTDVACTIFALITCRK